MEHHANSLNVAKHNMSPRHLSHLLANTAARFPGKEAIIFDGERITWSEVQRRVENLAGAFLEMGVQRGDRIGILCTTRPEYIVTYLAAARVGAMLVGFNVNFTAREIRKQAEIAKPTLMVVLRQMPVAAQLQSCFEIMPGVGHCIAIGEPAPDGWWRFELRIVDGDRKPVGPGQEGEIAVRGDCVMTGYFEEPGETAHVIDQEGWLYTGDLGRMDENGYLTVTGLIKKMYFSGGYNVYPAEVEAYLDQHPDIEQSACSGVPHPIMGETGEI